VKVRVRVKVKNGSRVEREDVLTQRRRDAECAEMFGRVEHVERVEGGECESGGSVAPRRSKEG
jgi:hypothetical protein